MITHNQFFARIIYEILLYTRSINAVDFHRCKLNIIYADKFLMAFPGIFFLVIDERIIVGIESTGFECVIKENEYFLNPVWVFRNRFIFFGVS